MSRRRKGAARRNSLLKSTWFGSRGKDETIFHLDLHILYRKEFPFMIEDDPQNFQFRNTYFLFLLMGKVGPQMSFLQLLQF